ncbi:MAG: hypothetical protein IMZ71_03860 [Chloroflexi bacterium]|nr:hypothetical protein [Chloroflexota bacterium]
MSVQAVIGSAYSFAVQESSSVFLDVVCKNENNVAVTPKTVTWSLYDDDDSIINSRQDVSATPGAITKIILAPEDTTLVGGAAKGRVIKVKATYDSDRGTDLTDTGGIRFRVLPV